MTGRSPAVAVISSHVASGGVGNRAAVFALERLGFPVVAVPTVILPFHPGHGPATRIVPPEAGFAALLDDLAGLEPPPGAMLTGYFGSLEQVMPAARLIDAVRRRNPSALYLLDPVLGDRGGLYRPRTLAEAMAAHLLPVADIATPNRFELGFLGFGMPPDNAGLAAAARRLGPREVVVTSAFASAGATACLLVTPDEAWLATHRTIDRAPHGAGDLLAALYLAARLRDCSPAAALARSVSATVAMIEAALAAGTGELPLAAAQDVLSTAPSGVAVTRLDEASR